MSLEDVDRLIDSSFAKLEGWCTPEKGKRMARLVVDAAVGHSDRPVLCVELGVFGGRGVIAMGLAVKHALSGHGLVEGIDPYMAGAALEGTNTQENAEWWSKIDYSKILNGAQEGIRQLDLTSIVGLLVRKSQEMIDRYVPYSIDVLHQDSNHSEEVSTKEVELWAPKMRQGGYWIFDDTNWATTRKAQELLVQKGFTQIEDHGSWAVFRAG